MNFEKMSFDGLGTDYEVGCSYNDESKPVIRILSLPKILVFTAFLRCALGCL